MGTVTKIGSRPQTPPRGTPQELEEIVANGIASLKALLSALKGQGLAALTGDDRLHTNGKLRDGEADALTAVLDTMEAHPDVFASLATKSRGTGKALGSATARAALARRDVLKPLAELLAAIERRVADDILEQGSLAKAVTMPGYAIIQANAPHSEALRTSAGPAIDFYQNVVKKKRETKAAENVARTAKEVTRAREKAAKAGSSPSRKRKR